jgi:hypothetical protein
MAILVVLTIVLVISITNNLTMSNTVDPYLPCPEALTNEGHYCRTDTSYFELLGNYAQNTTFFLRILAIAIFMIIVEILLLLNTQFPSFGVLFITLGKARTELFYFLVVVFTLMAGFLVFLMLNFGLNNDNMSTIGSGFVLLFQYVSLKLLQSNELVDWFDRLQITQGCKSQSWTNILLLVLRYLQFGFGLDLYRTFFINL